jgi:hypothetical protein
MLPFWLVNSSWCVGRVCCLDLHRVSNVIQSGMASCARRCETHILLNTVGLWLHAEPKHTLWNNGYSFSASILGAEGSACHQTKWWSSCSHLPSSHPKIHPDIISPFLWSSRWSFYKRFPDPRFSIYSLSSPCGHIPSQAQTCSFHLQFYDCLVISLATSIRYFSPNSTVKPS